MSQATTNVRLVLRERLAVAQAEAALLQELIDWLEGAPAPGRKIPKKVESKPGYGQKQCSKCKKVWQCHGRQRHCPGCRAKNSLKKYGAG